MYAVAVQKLLRNVTLNPKHQLYGNINFDDILLLTQLLAVKSL